MCEDVAHHSEAFAALKTELGWFGKLKNNVISEN